MVHNSFFPTPKFFSEPAFGLDISDESLKFIELTRSKDGFRVSRFGERKIEKGVIESGRIKDMEKMGEILKSLKKEEGLNSVRVSLPEEQVYLFNINLEKEGLEDIREGIELSLEEYIPIPAEDAIFDYEILGEDEKKFILQVAAIPKDVVNGYLGALKNAEISPSAFELEAQSITRSVVKKGDMETYMIVDFGEKRTGIFIVSKGIVIFTSTLEAGGAMLTEMIEKSFKIGFEEAEKKKRECGLRRNAKNAEVFSVLLNGVSILRDEISKHFIYWSTHKDEEGKERPQIKKIFLCGGDSNLTGICDYFSVSMKVSVEMANIWVNVIDIKKTIPDINLDESLTYATALGLALGNFEYD